MKYKSSSVTFLFLAAAYIHNFCGASVCLSHHCSNGWSWLGGMRLAKIESCNLRTGEGDKHTS